MSKDTTDPRQSTRIDEEVAARLLALAKPVADPAREALLLDRIVTTAARTPRLAPRLARTEALPHDATPLVTGATAQPAAAPRVMSAGDVVPFVTPRSRAPIVRADVWKIASVLAASLVIGFMAGLSPSVSDRAVNTLEEATGLTFASLPQELAATLATAEHGDF